MKWIIIYMFFFFIFTQIMNGHNCVFQFGDSCCPLWLSVTSPNGVVSRLWSAAGELRWKEDAPIDVDDRLWRIIGRNLVLVLLLPWCEERWVMVRRGWDEGGMMMMMMMITTDPLHLHHHHHLTQSNSRSSSGFSHFRRLDFRWPTLCWVVTLETALRVFI